MFLLWGRMACHSLEVATMRLPVGLGEVRIASDADSLDHWVTHAYIVPPLKVHPGGNRRSVPPGDTRDDFPFEHQLGARAGVAP